MEIGLDDLEHPSFATAGGTLVGYALLLVAMAALLFGVPYLVFTAL